MQFFLKTSRGEPAAEVSSNEGRQILTRLRHEGRKLVDVFVLADDGTLERLQERTRRRLGSNAVASRTWLCETAQDGEWGNGRYIPEPLDAIESADPPAAAVVLVLAGAEGAPEDVVEQLQGMTSSR
ncbi:MAG TPA: hypothetical protein VMM78_07710 [Thermomicrobiales bacterium]|nr:hypothetical protein [Thermomicrobiales bacterium]